MPLFTGGGPGHTWSYRKLLSTYFSFFCCPHGIVAQCQTRSCWKTVLVNNLLKTLNSPQLKKKPGLFLIKKIIQWTSQKGTLPNFMESSSHHDFQLNTYTHLLLHYIYPRYLVMLTRSLLTLKMQSLTQAKHLFFYSLLQLIGTWC